jgi:hypothetical protein
VTFNASIGNWQFFIGNLISRERASWKNLNNKRLPRMLLLNNSLPTSAIPALFQSAIGNRQFPLPSTQK